MAASRLAKEPRDFCKCCTVWLSSIVSAPFAGSTTRCFWPKPHLSLNWNSPHPLIRTQALLLLLHPSPAPSPPTRAQALVLG